MLKIKDNIDIKELEKFGYKNEEWDIYYRKKENDYRVQIDMFNREILVFKYRKDSNWGIYIGHLKEEEEKLKEYIQDLVKADLVEKVRNRYERYKI